MFGKRNELQLHWREAYTSSFTHVWYNCWRQIGKIFRFLHCWVKKRAVRPLKPTSFLTESLYRQMEVRRLGQKEQYRQETDWQVFQHWPVMVPPGVPCFYVVSDVLLKMFLHDLYYLERGVCVCARASIARCWHRLPIKSAHVDIMVYLSSSFTYCSPVTCWSMPVLSLIRSCLHCPTVCSLLYSGTQLLIKAR